MTMPAPARVTFYDRDGVPTAYLHKDGSTIYRFSGEPVAYVYHDAVVYCFSGRYLGWYARGWLWDSLGNPVFYAEQAHGFGPRIPVRQTTPQLIASRQRPPAKKPRHDLPHKSFPKVVCLERSGAAFFAGSVSPARVSGARHNKARGARPTRRSVGRVLPNTWTVCNERRR